MDSSNLSRVLAANVARLASVYRRRRSIQLGPNRQAGTNMGLGTYMV